MIRILSFLIALLVCFQSCNTTKDNGSGKIELLFLGHDSEHHNSAKYMPMLASALAKEGITITYTDQLFDLNPQTLAKYDGLIIYANHEEINPEQEEAILNFVKGGKGFIPVHSASYCFLNSPKYIELVGGQFQKHEIDSFKVSIIHNDHPAVLGVEEFVTWDETYVHHKLTDDRLVLMERTEGDHREPWTWVKEHGKGRVFYTAYGHDEKTWSNPGFHSLMKQGILWAVGDKVKSQWEAFQSQIPELVYHEEPNIPNYEKRFPPPLFQEPLSPEDSKKLIQVPVGFELELFASEPDIIKPISMEWDEKGRLWVIETIDYPNTVLPGDGVGNDRIKILEDTNGDGRADKVTVFADKLNIPTSLVFANGGIIVSQAPYFLFLKDTDGDDVADVREVLMDGWGTFDTHAGPSNLTYGLDNKIWGVVGYSGFKGPLDGSNKQFSQGIYRFASDGSDFEFMTSTSNNTWGLGFTENNDVFASTANNTHSVFMGIPDRIIKGIEGIPATGSTKIDGHYAMHPITQNVRQVDVFGGFTAAAGHSFYTARNYPKEFWNNTAFVCEPTGHLIHIAKVEKDGAGFVEKDGWNLLASADEWVSPVEAKVGPDGNVWVLDWYNFIIQHNPTPTPERGGYSAVNGPGNAYENPLRDRGHGRIWRLVYSGAKPVKNMTLDKTNARQLVQALSNDNMFWRLTAQRVIIENGMNDVLPDLFKLARNKKVDEMGSNYAAIHALWTIHGLGEIKNGTEASGVVIEALKHPSAGVRKAAVMVLPKEGWAGDAILEANLIYDEDPNTRLAAVLLLGETPLPGVGEKLYELSQLDDVRSDNWLARAVYASATRHKDNFMMAYMKEHHDHTGMQHNQHSVNRYEMDINDSGWKTMRLPQYIEQAGEDIDGIIWFRKAIDIPENASGKKATLSLGPIDDSDETWVNGIKIGGIEKDYAKDRIYTIPGDVTKPGKNVIAIKVTDTGGGGGFYGKAEQMFFQSGDTKISLTGDWSYEVEEVFRGTSRKGVFQDASIAEVFIKTYSNKPTEEKELVVSSGGTTVIQIRAVQHQMVYDRTAFVVEAGKPVEIVFSNPDFMQHNLVITKPGQMEKVGEAADKLASDPKGADRQYVPDMPEVLFYTKLINPQQSETLRFIAPSDPGDYPYICTFPGHWKIMKGTMKVVKAKPSI